MKEPRIVLLTGNELRHRYVAWRLAEKCNLLGVISEEKAQVIADPDLLLPGDMEVIRNHFAERKMVERRLLGDVQGFPDTEFRAIAHGAINQPRYADWIAQLEPDAILLYGTGIIKPPLLTSCSGCLLNLHLGLSPYYRGSGTNFWPLVNREPECVGATIHLAVAKVDAGPILTQVRPDAEAADRAHELGTKTIIAALNVMPDVLIRYLHGSISPREQDLYQGRVYKQSDFTAGAVRTMWKCFDRGMMLEYLENINERQARYSIVQMATVSP